MRNKWFWTTFSVWFFLGITVTAWPLIYSPFHLNQRKISEFEIETNGSKQNHQIWVSSALIEPYENEIIGRWKKDGWLPLNDKLELTPYLLGFEKNQPAFPDQLRVKIFEKNELIKILGLWNNFKTGQTYCWTAELPAKALKDKQTTSACSFPLKAPANTLNVYWGKSKNLQFACWTLLSHPYPEEQFREIFASQGFNGKVWDRRQTEVIYLLEKGSTHLVAVLKPRATEETISLMVFNKK